MTWLSQNWFFMLFGLLFVGMHLGHGGHGGHGAHGGKGSTERPPSGGDGRSLPGRDEAPGANGPAGHNH